METNTNLQLTVMRSPARGVRITANDKARNTLNIRHISNISSVFKHNNYKFDKAFLLTHTHIHTHMYSHNTYSYLVVEHSHQQQVHMTSVYYLNQ